MPELLKIEQQTSQKYKQLADFKEKELAALWARKGEAIAYSEKLLEVQIKN